MAYPTTPNLGLPLVPDGDQAWGPAMRGAMQTLDAKVPTRGERTVRVTTLSLAFYQTALVEVDLTLACDLTVLVTDHPAWVRFYGSAAARTEDATRLVSQKVRDGRGCYGDGITYLPDGLLLNWSEVPTFHNLDTPRTGKCYLAVTNMDPAYSGPITVDTTYLPIEDLLPGQAQGPPGLSGRTVLVLARDPVATDGQDGDGAINNVTWRIFAPKAGGVWPAGASLVGATGATGLPGTNGTNGTNGLNGKNLLHGTTDPTAATGVNDEYYINDTTHYLFGPKAAGAWPVGVSLVGPAGSGGVLRQDLIVMGTAGTTTTVVTDFAPTITEGLEVARVTITPTAIGSRIVVRAKSRSSLNVAWNGDHAAIFNVGTTNRLTMSRCAQQIAAWENEHSLLYLMTTANLNPITFSLRAGSMAAGTYTVYGDSWIEAQELNP